MKLIPDKQLLQKAIQLDALTAALANGLSYDKFLLRHYKYWAFDHEITHSLLEDTKIILESLKKLSKIQCKKERFSMLKNIQNMTNNIYSYCRGLEYHSLENKDYLGVYRKELSIFSAFFQKYFKAHTIH